MTIHLLIDRPQTFDRFPAGAARSVKGALHLTPGATVRVTDDEAAAMRADGIAFYEVQTGRPKPAAPVPEPVPAKIPARPRRAR